jgi:hypothetical protein
VIKTKYSTFSKFIDLVIKIYTKNELLPEQLKTFLTELETHNIELKELFNSENQLFKEIYAEELTGISDSDLDNIKSKLPLDMFISSTVSCHSKVRDETEKHKVNLLRQQMINKWKEKTESDNPYHWSTLHETPIMCCVSESDYEEAKKVFNIINRALNSSDSEIQEVIDFMEVTQVFEVMNDENKRDEAFLKNFVRKYSKILTDVRLIRTELDKLNVSVYDWRDNYKVENKLKELNEIEYKTNGEQKVLSKIDNMSDTQLKQYLKRLIKTNPIMGIEILTDESEI